MRGIGIRSIGVVLGERELDARTLAEEAGVPEELLVQLLGDSAVEATDRSRVELVRDAVIATLGAAGLSTDELDLLLTCRSLPTEDGAARLETALGHPTLHTLELRGPCTVFMHAITVAWLMIESGHATRPVVAFGEASSHGAARLMVDEDGRPHHVFSDCAGAVILERGGPLVLRGFGIAAGNRRADANDRLVQVKQGVDDCAAALDRCLTSAGLALGDFDLVLFPSETRSARTLLARRMKVAPRQVREPLSRAHKYGLDSLYHLAQLLREGACPTGTRVLCCARDPRTAAFLAFEVQGEVGVG